MLLPQLFPALPCLLPQLQLPEALSRVARQDAGPTHLSLTAWMASAALS